ncbi:MAG: hypothetical protein M1837_003523 [Sclerophora amabilis]|nr:MAG: hypothetical protein M1837_003523 [Sclerophora amabilis]
MASFLINLFNSSFTCGATPTHLVAINASFAGFQLLLGAILIATRSIHVMILSFLFASVWWAINWFVTELQVASDNEEEAESRRRTKIEQDSSADSSDDTQTEGSSILTSETAIPKSTDASSSQGATEAHRRRSSGEASAEASTEDEWEKVSEQGGSVLL